MEKPKKLELLKRQLGLRHKLKVHDSMKQAETHEEIASMLIAKWEFEDEIQAIEELISQARMEAVREKREQILKELNRGGKLTKSWAEKRDFHDGVNHTNGHEPSRSADASEDDEEAPAPSKSGTKGRGTSSRGGGSAPRKG